MKLAAIFIGLFALASRAFADLAPASGEAIVDGETGNLTFLPTQTAPFSLIDGILNIGGLCTLTGTSHDFTSQGCSLPVLSLLTATPCKLISIKVGKTNINVLGLRIKLPNGLLIKVRGTTGLLGSLLCTLLGPGGLLGGLNLLNLNKLLRILNKI